MIAFPAADAAAAPTPLVVPAVDLMAGRCVRLRRGHPDMVTLSEPCPVTVAARFAAAGARRLHLVDLDAAMGQPSSGLDMLRRVVREVGIPVQFGGGLRDVDGLCAAVEAGATWVISATAALERHGFLAAALRACGERLIAALDLRDGRPLVRGWQSDATVDLAGALAAIGDAGVRTVLVTDVTGDGTLGGLDLNVLEPVLDRPFGVISAGGVSRLDDIRAVAALAPRGVAGIVSGSALLAGRFTLREAQEAADAAASAAYAAVRARRSGAAAPAEPRGEEET